MQAEEIEEALTSLADLLTEQGVTCSICVVGGAALALRFHARTSTQDVDAWYREPAVDEAAQVVADRFDLPRDWLNSKASMFLPNWPDPEWEPLWTRGSVMYCTASARTLLAMKLRAGRPIRDGPDIDFLLTETSITRYEDAVAVFEYFYPQEVMSAKAKTLLRASLKANAGKEHRSTR